MYHRYCRISSYTLIYVRKLQQITMTHYNDVIMLAMTSQITSVSIVCSSVCSGSDQRKYQSSVSLAFVRGIHWWPMDSPHKGSVTQKVFPYVMTSSWSHERHGFQTQPLPCIGSRLLWRHGLPSSPRAQLFIQQHVHADMKEILKTPHF